MANFAEPSLVAAIEKLAIAGQQAGLSVEQMIDLLNDGMAVDTLLDLIECRLEAPHTPPILQGSSSNWVAAPCRA
jgi:hypothetical protein